MKREKKQIQAFALKEAKRYILEAVRYRKENLDYATREVKKAKTIYGMLRVLNEECDMFNQGFEDTLVKHLAGFFWTSQ